MGSIKYRLETKTEGVLSSVKLGPDGFGYSVYDRPPVKGRSVRTAAGSDGKKYFPPYFFRDCRPDVEKISLHVEPRRLSGLGIQE